MKRIICSILVVVMLALSLVGCGYSFADDNMTKYADFSNQTKFEELIKKIFIEDGDFTADDEIRKERVLEDVYAAIASAVKKDAEAKKDGTPGERDVVYYSYYVTAVIDDETVYLYNDKMKTANAASIQLRPSKNYGEDELSKKIAELLAAYNFDDYVYTSVVSGTTVEGDVAYVSFAKTIGDATPVTYTNHRIVIGAAPEGDAAATTFESYLCGKKISSSSSGIEKFEEKDADGKVVATYSSIKINWVSSRETYGTAKEGDKVYVSYTKKVGDGKAEPVPSTLVTVGAAVGEGETATTLESYLAGKTIAATKDEDVIADFTVTEGETTTKYTDIKIDWRVGEGKEIGTVVDTTYDEKTELADSVGSEKNDLDGVELTYHIYPTYYNEIPEYSSEVLIDKILGEKLTADALYEIIFIKEISELDDDATEDDRDEIKKGADKYKTNEAEPRDIEKLVKDILAYYDDIKTAQTSLDNAEEKLSKAKTAYEEAQIALEKAQEEGADADKIAELQAALKTADEALNGKKAENSDDRVGGAQSKKDDAQAEYDKIGEDKLENIRKLLAIVGEGEEETLDAKIERNYKIATYDYLQLTYNEEIKNNLAKEIYFFLTENITLNGKLPQKAVDDAYTQLFETYESEFYTGTYNTTTKESNYKHYKGDFNEYLINKVNEEFAEEDWFVKVETVKAAKEAIKQKATESVKPLVQIFLAAQTYDQVITDKEYEEYKDELEDYYYYYVLYYKNFSIEEMLGKTNMMAAAQFNKLMDWFLEYEESKTDADENGYVKITYDYKNELCGDYEIGTPASEAEDEAETE